MFFVAGVECHHGETITVGLEHDSEGDGVSTINARDAHENNGC